MARADRPKNRTINELVSALPRDQWLTAAEARAFVRMEQSGFNKRLQEACAHGLLQRRNRPGTRGFVYMRNDTMFSSRRASAPYPKILYGPGVPDASAQIGAVLRSHMQLCARK